MRTIQQQFASAVYDHILSYQNDHSETDQKKYGSMAIKLPFLVQRAGLAQALAFVNMKAESDSGEPYKDLLGHLSQIVVEEGQQPLLQASISADLPEYIYLTKRTLLALEWFNRFSQSILKVKQTDEVQGS